MTDIVANCRSFNIIGDVLFIGIDCTRPTLHARQKISSPSVKIIDQVGLTEYDCCQFFNATQTQLSLFCGSNRL